MEINSFFRDGKQRMMFLVSMMIRHTEKSRRGIPWRNTACDEREGRKCKCCCGKITEGGDRVEEAFCEQQLKSPEELMELWWHPEPFWEGTA